MKTLRTALAALLLTAGAVVASGCSYNTFVSQEESIKTQWAQVENQLQRRNDLIPNLVETTKGIAQQERDVFGQIAESRAKMAGAQTPEQRIQAANEQSSALARLLVVVENYPGPEVERAVQPADRTSSRAPRTASPSSGCGITSACRSTTRSGGASRRT